MYRSLRFLLRCRQNFLSSFDFAFGLRIATFASLAAGTTTASTFSFLHGFIFRLAFLVISLVLHFNDLSSPYLFDRNRIADFDLIAIEQQHCLLNALLEQIDDQAVAFRLSIVIGVQFDDRFLCRKKRS